MYQVFFIVMTSLISTAGLEVATANEPNLGLTSREAIEYRGGGSAADLLHQTKINLDAPSAKSKVQLTTGCVDAHGTSLKPEDPSYERCLIDAKNKQTFGTGTHAKPSVGIKFGE